MAAVGQLISGVAHELNNPLTAILGYGELLASGHFLNAQGAEYVEKIYKQAQRTHRIVHNLLSFARQHKPERMPVQLNQILDDTLALREYDLRANNIIVHREFTEDLPPISADAHQLQQVFLNMLNNALDAVLEGPNAGELWLRTAQDSATRRLIVEFTDNGRGVAELPKVFDPFYTTKPVGKGTGLGLSICYGIVTEHGGEITARNVPPRGACFTIQLPLLQSENRVRSGNRVGNKSSGRSRILLVDSEDAVLDLEREFLRPHHRSVYAVRNAREAVRLLDLEQFDLVVSEWRERGDFAGPEFFDWICKFWPDLANHIVFVISGTSEVESAPISIQQSCLFLRKPFQVEELLAAVQQMLGEREALPLKNSVR
jgi:two-component system NtrC family sensor kinase